MGAAAQCRGSRCGTLASYVPSGHDLEFLGLKFVGRRELMGFRGSKIRAGLQKNRPGDIQAGLGEAGL